MISQTELKAIVKLDPIKRYKYFLKRIADSESMFSLGEDENPWILSYNNEQALVLWPFEEFVGYYKSKRKDFDDSKPIKISIYELDNKEVAKLKDNGINTVDIFPIDENCGHLIKIDDFILDLNRELENYS